MTCDSVSCSSLNSHELQSKVLNTVQCEAISTLGFLLYENDKYIPRSLEIAERLVLQDNILIRTALIAILIPLLNYNREKAVELFLRTIRTDYIIGTTGNAIRFFNYTIYGFYEKLVPVLHAMKNSLIAEISRAGYLLMVEYRFFYPDIFRNLQIEISLLDEDVRNSLAEFFAAQLEKDSCFDDCMAMLKIFFNDKSKEVREGTRNALYAKVQNQSQLYFLLKTFISSQAFGDNFLEFFSVLKDKYYNSLHEFTDVIFYACETLLNKWKNQIGNPPQWSDELFPVLVRLYNDELKNDINASLRCLDYIDSFLFYRIGFEGLLKKIDDEIS